MSDVTMTYVIGGPNGETRVYIRGEEFIIEDEFDPNEFYFSREEAEYLVEALKALLMH